MKSKRAKLIVDIFIYTLAGIFFLLAIICIILKFSGNSISLFGRRYDVVLTDSMSEKNPEYEEFLKGHDNQIQAMDVVITNTSVSDESLNVYDIVLFKNPELGDATDMHRIVDKTIKDQDEITISNSYFQTINGIEGFSFKNVSGGIVSNVICATQMTLVTYSTELDERDHFVFSYSTGFYDTTVTREVKDGGYYTTYHLETGSTSPRKLAVAHKAEYDYSKEVICSCTIESIYGTIDLKKENVIEAEGGYQGIFNTSYYYEIRGDKANTSDGKHFTIDDIYGKVVGRIPKIGYAIRYLSSVWGMILLIGLGAIMITFDVVTTHINKKEQQASTEPNNENVEKDEKKGKE